MASEKKKKASKVKPKKKAKAVRPKPLKAVKKILECDICTSRLVSKVDYCYGCQHTVCADCSAIQGEDYARGTHELCDHLLVNGFVAVPLLLNLGGKVLHVTTMTRVVEVGHELAKDSLEGDFDGDADWWKEFLEDFPED